MFFIQEYNSTTVPYVLGSLKHPPIQLGSILWSTDLRIVAFNHDFKVSRSVAIDSWIESFDSLTYIYTLICILVFVSWFTFFAVCNDWISLSVARWFKKSRTKNEYRRIQRAVYRSMKVFPKIFFDSIIAMTDQQLIDPSFFPLKILVILFYIATFILIQGYYTNVASTDMVAFARSPFIDRLDDFLNDPQYRELTVASLGGVWHEIELKNSLDGSLEHRLWERIQNEGIYIPIKIYPKYVREVSDELIPLVKQKRIVVMDRRITPSFRSLLCRAKNRLMKYIAFWDMVHTSREGFGHVILVPMFSIHSDESFVKYVSYKHNQLFQSHILQNIIDTVGRKDLDNVESNTRYSFNNTMCNDSVAFEGILSVLKSFPFKFFQPLFWLCLYMVSIAIITLILEKLSKCCTKKLRHKSAEMSIRDTVENGS